MGSSGLSVGKGLARTQGAALLSLLAVAGWALFSTAPIPIGPKVEVDGGESGRYLAVLDRPQAPGGHSHGNRVLPLLILSKVPFEYDTGRSLVSFRTSDQRIVPGGASTVMIHDRSIEALRALAIPLSWLEDLRAQPASLRAARLTELLQGSRKIPPNLPDERLRKFWLEPP